jgi:hypothetical protein
MKSLTIDTFESADIVINNNRYNNNNNNDNTMMELQMDDVKMNAM